MYYLGRFLCHDLSVTVYGRIADGLRVQIATMADGDLLPSLPQLQSTWKVSVLTVRRAFQVLEREGLITTHGGRRAIVARARTVPCPRWAVYALSTPEGNPIWMQVVGEVVILRVIP